MTKRFSFALLFALMGIACMQAQSKVATLTHAGEVRMFYGTNAFAEAMAAADHGDVITLSSGAFKPAPITKAITLRGAGTHLTTDSLHPSDATMFFDAVEIAVPDTIAEHLRIEGVFFPKEVKIKAKLNSPTFVQCRFETFTYESSSAMYGIQNALFVHCRVANTFRFATYSTITFVNSIVFEPMPIKWGTYTFTNCIVLENTADFATYTNCILCINSNRYHCIYQDCHTYRCLSTIDGYFNHPLTDTNDCFTNSSYEQIFQTCRSFTYDEEERYLLTDAAMQRYKGTDGKPVGLYGGSQPYTDIPATPYIHQCHIATEADEDGKLPVEVIIKNAD